MPEANTIILYFSDIFIRVCFGSFEMLLLTPIKVDFFFLPQSQTISPKKIPFGNLIFACYRIIVAIVVYICYNSRSSMLRTRMHKISISRKFNFNWNEP